MELSLGCGIIELFSCTALLCYGTVVRTTGRYSRSTDGVLLAVLGPRNTRTQYRMLIPCLCLSLALERERETERDWIARPGIVQP